MASENLPGLDVTQVHLACGRIAGVARAIVEAHRFGKPEGPHERPWTAECHREAVKIYGHALPQSYQRNIGAVFGRSAEVMGELSIPAALAEDWLIISEYLQGASLSIDHWLSTTKPGPEPETVAPKDSTRPPRSTSLTIEPARSFRNHLS